MEIAIVDDERSCQEELTELLRSFGASHRCQLELTAFDSAEEFLSALPHRQFSVVFMDIFMAGMDGVAAAARLWEADKKCLLIFLTSSGEFRPDALSVHAFEYIIKPFPPERVTSVLEDVLSVLPQTSKYIQVVSERKTVSLLLHDITSVQTDAHYVEIGLTDSSVVRSRMTIQEFLRLVEGEPNFITVNKGIVLNADFVARFEDSCCVMENGARFPVRVRDRAQVEQAVLDYHFTKIRSRQRHGQ